jgi:hypothetical protein
MAEVIGTIHLDTTTPRAQATSILAKIISVSITWRNRLPRWGDKIRDEGRKTLPYFFGILRRMQEERDIARHEDYCRQRYHHQQLVERERQRARDDDQLSLHTLMEMLRSAIALPTASIKEIAMRQVDRMVAQLKKQYPYLGVLKNAILDAVTGLIKTKPD